MSRLSRKDRRAVQRWKDEQQAAESAGQPGQSILTRESLAQLHSEIGLGLPGGMGGYQAAWQSDQRGYLYWPFAKDPEREIDTYSREEVARRGHWAAANLGIGRRIKVGLSNLAVGTGLTVRPLTKDATFNAAAAKSYNRRANSANTYDVRGRINGRLAQRLLVMTKLVDGDCAVVRSRSQTGAALRAFYGGLQIGNSAFGSMGNSFAYQTGGQDPRWRDGLYLDSIGRTAFYRFPQLDGSVRDVPASAVSFLCNYETFGQLRGMSIFAHCTPKIIDKTEAESAWMKNLKNSAQIGYFLKKEIGSPTLPDARSRMQSGGNLSVTQPVTNKAITQKMVYGTGGEIPDLPPGFDIKMLLDERPHTNQQELIWEFLRDVAQGCGMHPEVLWNITKLGGANIRYVLAELAVWIALQQQALVDQFLYLDYVDHTSCELAAGRLEYPVDDPEWWHHGWIPPERITVDFGRDGAIMLKQYQAGLITADRWFSMRGQDAREETIRHLDFIAWRKQELAERGLRLEEAYPPQAGAAMAAVATADELDPVDPVDPKETSEAADESDDESDATL